MLRVLVPLVVVAGLLIALTYGTAGPGEDRPSGVVRAAPGDTVWIVLNHVKPERRESFERFVEEVVQPALEELAPKDSLYQHLLETARVLYPTNANEDGTYTYVYLMERYMPGDYTYRRLLTGAYGVEEAEEYLTIPGDALDRPQEVYFVVQNGSFEEVS